MIHVTVCYGENSTDIEFPCSDRYLQSKLTELNVTDLKETTFYIGRVVQPESLSMLEYLFVNLDELNYFAKRLDGFDHNEMMQFNAVARQYDMKEMKELINLTFNLGHYTLIQDISSMEKVGRTHILNLQGGLGEEEMETCDFEAVGKKLIASGRGKITEYGILFENEELPFEEVYDGQVFPEYIYKDCLISAEIRFGDKAEYAYLPCDEIEIEKALHRLGVNDIGYCEIYLSNINVAGEKWFNVFKDILKEEGLNEVRRLAKAVNSFTEPDEWNKLSAVAAFADVQESRPLAVLAENLDTFIFIPDIQDQEQLARYWIEHNEEYELSPELEDFFLYDQFGEQIENDTEGVFLDEGYVCLDGSRSLEEILGASEIQNIAMGGI